MYNTRESSYFTHYILREQALGKLQLLQNDGLKAAQTQTEFGGPCYPESCKNLVKRRGKSHFL